jgi:hypothetical protein
MADVDIFNRSDRCASKIMLLESSLCIDVEEQVSNFER